MTIEVLIQQLVDQAITYHKAEQGKPLSVEDFAVWLMASEKKGPDKTILGAPFVAIDTELSAQIGRLARYGNTYLKQALGTGPFTTNMEFIFSAMLQQHGPLGKSALIKLMVYEKSSGMEIIKRLLKSGLIVQYPNPDDGRSKLLRLTENGMNALIVAYKNAGLAAKVVAAPLSVEEKKSLLVLLQKLDDYHEAIYRSGENPLDALLNTKEE